MERYLETSDVAKVVDSGSNPPTFPECCNGKFYHSMILRILSTPSDEQRLLYVHNELLQSNLNPTPPEMIYLMNSSYLGGTTVATNYITCSPVSKDNDVIMAIEVYGYGNGLPEKWKAPVHVSNAAVLYMLKKATNNCLESTTETLPAVTHEEWAKIKVQMTENAKSPANINKHYSLMAAVCCSLCRMGKLSHQTKEIEAEVSAMKNAVVTLNNILVLAFWKTVSEHMTMDFVSRLMRYLEEQFEEPGIHLQKMMQFAKYKGLTTYYAIKDAFQQASTFPWHQVKQAVPDDFKRYKAVRELVKDRPYFGYGPLGVASAENFPTLGYVGIELCKKALGQDALKFFQSSTHSTHIVQKSQWDPVIDCYCQKMSSLKQVGSDQEYKDYPNLIANMIEEPESGKRRHSDDDQGLQGGADSNSQTPPTKRL